MTISLKEHVARAIEGCTSHNLPKTTFDNMACAAIAVVREYDAADVDAETGCADDKSELGMAVECLMRGSQTAIAADRASIRESERAACEAITREESEAARPDFHGRVDPCELAANRIAARKSKGEGI